MNDSKDSPKGSTKGKVSMGALARETNGRIDQVRTVTNKARDFAMALGEQLLVNAAAMGQGRWEPWHANNIDMPVEDARKYMAAAGNKERPDTLPDTKTCLRLALQLVEEALETELRLAEVDSTNPPEAQIGASSESPAQCDPAGAADSNSNVAGSSPPPPHEDILGFTAFFLTTVEPFIKQRRAGMLSADENQEVYAAIRKLLAAVKTILNEYFRETHTHADAAEAALCIYCPGVAQRQKIREAAHQLAVTAGVA